MMGRLWVLVEGLNVSNPWYFLCAAGSIILNVVVKTLGNHLDLVDLLRKRPRTVSFQKRLEFIEQRRNCQLLKKDSADCSGFCSLICINSSFFFIVSWLVLSFRASFHVAGVWLCVMTSTTEMNYLLITLHALPLRGVTAFQLSVPDRKQEVRNPVPPVFFSLFSINIKVNQKWN